MAWLLYKDSPPPGKAANSKGAAKGGGTKATSSDPLIDDVLRHKFWAANVTEKEVKAILKEMGAHVEGTLFVGRKGEVHWTPTNFSDKLSATYWGMEDCQETIAMADFGPILLKKHPFPMRAETKTACVILKDELSDRSWLYGKTCQDIQEDIKETRRLSLENEKKREAEEKKLKGKP